MLLRRVLCKITQVLIHWRTHLILCILMIQMGRCWRLWKWSLSIPIVCSIFTHKWDKFQLYHLYSGKSFSNPFRFLLLIFFFLNSEMIQLLILYILSARRYWYQLLSSHPLKLDLLVPWHFLTYKLPPNPILTCILIWQNCHYIDLHVRKA